MAQGFVTTANLKESDTLFSDSAILDNLYGRLGISTDIRLFKGNLGFKSILSNNPSLLSESVSFGQFIPNERYVILDLGVERDWTSVGWVANEDGHGDNPSLNDVFVADDTGLSQDGIGELGSAGLLVSIREFNVEYDPDDGWTAFVIPRQGRVAFTLKTLISIDGGANFDYIVTNSDGRSRFQLNEISTGLVWDFDTGNGPGNVDDLTLVRKDTITVENMQNAHVTPTGTVVTLVERSDPNTLSVISPDPFGSDVLDDLGQVQGTGGGLVNIQSRLSQLESKKREVVLTYQDNEYSTPDGIRFDGMFRITNDLDINNKSIKIGIDTLFGDLYIGQKYEIVEVGTSLWHNAGTNTLAPGIESFDLTPSSIKQNKVYKIIDFGYSSRGNQDPNDNAPLGGFRFTIDDIDTSSQTIELVSSGDHELQDGDKVRYNDDGTNSIAELTDNEIYFVKRVDTQKIQLSEDSNLSTNFSLTPPIGGFFRLTIDTEADWNAISGQTNVPYAPGSINNLFKAVNLSAASGISEAKVAPAIFIATNPGNATGTPDIQGGGLARAVDANGLYITNPSNGESKRAFTGTDNPWSKEENKDIDVTSRVSFYQDSGGNLLPGVTHDGAGNYDLTTPVLKTSSGVAQAGNFIFDRSDLTKWDTSKFIIGETYTITDLGTGRDWTQLYDETDYVDMEVGKYYVITSVGSRDWQYITQRSDYIAQSGDTILVKVSGESQGASGGGLGYELASEGMSFLATDDGYPGGNQASGSGGEALGEPKLLITNDNQDELDGDGLLTDSAALGSSFTHKIPVTINGDSYFLLAIYEYDQIPFDQLQEGQEVIIQTNGSQRDWIAIGSSSTAPDTKFTVNSQVSANSSQGSGGTAKLFSGSGTYKVLTTAT